MPRSQLLPDDVPSPIDLRKMSDARAWAETAMVKRPVRDDVFRLIIEELLNLRSTPLSVLELGSGPGYLAERIITEMKALIYTAFDSSVAMHALARERLGAMAEYARFVVGDFKQVDWTKDLGSVDAVVTVQAVHELRHKRYVPALYEQVADVLVPSGVFLMCDHYVGGGAMSDRALFMTLEEHEGALQASGFTFRVLIQSGGLVLYRAERA